MLQEGSYCKNDRWTHQECPLSLFDYGHPIHSQVLSVRSSGSKGTCRTAPCDTVCNSWSCLRHCGINDLHMKHQSRITAIMSHHVPSCPISTAFPDNIFCRTCKSTSGSPINNQQHPKADTKDKHQITYHKKSQGERTVSKFLNSNWLMDGATAQACVWQPMILRDVKGSALKYCRSSSSLMGGVAYGWILLNTENIKEHLHRTRTEKSEKHGKAQRLPPLPSFCALNSRHDPFRPGMHLYQHFAKPAVWVVLHLARACKISRFNCSNNLRLSLSTGLPAAQYHSNVSQFWRPFMFGQQVSFVKEFARCQATTPTSWILDWSHELPVKYVECM